MRPPVQSRSEASLERFVSAMEKLVRQHGFRKTSLNMICTEAGLTSGAFYSRFSRKEELALPLWHRIEPRTDELVERFGQELKRASLEKAVHALILDVADFYQREGVLIRELTSLAPHNPELAAAMRQSNENHLQRLVQLVLGSGEEISHPGQAGAVTLGLVCVLNTLRELILDQVLFETSRDFSPELLAQELTRLFLSYLRS